MNSRKRPVIFTLFFISGFCGLVYQIVWTRLAFASFGIITPVMSVVISVFMLGLSVGSWAGGRYVATLVRRTGLSAAGLYALAELMIGLGAFAVPTLFRLGEQILLSSGQSDSARYLFSSAVVLVIAILPWCIFMGATFPLMMAYLREREPATVESFSYLYLANVLGAVAGTGLSALVLIEVLGFRHTLWVAAAGNFMVATISGRLAWEAKRRLVARTSEAGNEPQDGPPAAGAADGPPPTPARKRMILWVLFSTGFCSMAMEVVWTRAFTPVLKTQVYSFALVVAVYLSGTFLGSALYRRHLRQKSLRKTAELLAALSAAAFLPILLNDARLVKANWLYAADPASVALVLASIVPFCAILGYLTPGLVDEFAGGAPARAGRIYALNVLGCILGPLFACYGLLPFVSEHQALVWLGLPFVGFFLFAMRELPKTRRLGFGMATGAALFGASFFSRSYEDHIFRTEKQVAVRRDHAASVLTYGEGFYRLLCVNGLGMTTLTPITKFMIHLPLALHQGESKSALVICFGMGTSYRSALSWDVDTTAVELVPSVKETFGFFHADAAQVRQNPKGRMVVDDGRRYLKRTQEKYDLIVVDPPPPLEAAGSSLLFSKEFFELAQQHLKPNGILQAWYPGGELRTGRAMLRSLHETFPHVRCYDSVEKYGAHLLASMEPIPTLTGAEAAARMPAAAQKDLLEWSPGQELPAYLDQVLATEHPLETILDPDLRIRITDDHPYNEYFLLRRWDLF